MLPVTRSRLLLGVAATLAGTSVVMVGLGLLTNVLILVLALPIGAAAAIIWADVTGRLPMRFRRRIRSRADHPGAQDRRRRHRVPASSTTTDEERTARKILGVEADADMETIRRAFRDRVKEAHPDADGGSETEFKRVTDAYDRLQD